jgi:hypothetical protein
MGTLQTPRSPARNVEYLDMSPRPSSSSVAKAGNVLAALAVDYNGDPK